jgi:hypothetical protein
MVSKRLGIYGFISAAAIVSGILAGCGGSSANVQGATSEVATTGGITNTSSTQATGTASSTSPQQVQVTVNGQQVMGTLPANETITGGESVSVTPPGVPIIQGMQLSSPQFGGHVTTPSIGSLTTKPATGTAKPTTGSQGQVYVDGVNTGLTITANGSLSGYLILVPGNHTITAYGPFYIVGGSVFSPTVLTVGVFNFGVLVANDGVGSIPSNLNMKLPGNGGSWAHGPFVTVTYPTPDFAGGNATLQIVVDSARTIQENRTVVNGVASFYSLGASQISHNIPSGGVISVTYNYL